MSGEGAVTAAIEQCASCWTGVDEWGGCQGGIGERVLGSLRRRRGRTRRREASIRPLTAASFVVFGLELTSRNRANIKAANFMKTT